MALVSATEEEYKAFLDKYGYGCELGQESLLALSFAFLSSLPFCDGANVAQTEAITEAQMFIAYAMSEKGGGFNPAALADAKTLIKRNIGRSAIVREYEVNELLAGTDPMSQLRKIPMALGLLNQYLCPVAVAGEDAPFIAGAFVV